MADRVRDLLRDQLKDDSNSYQLMKLEELVLSQTFITDSQQLSSRNENKNSIYIFKHFGVSDQLIISKLEVKDEDISRSKKYFQMLNLKNHLKEIEELEKAGHEESSKMAIKIRNDIEILESEWILVALELDSDIILNQYLHYLFTRTAGNLMARTLMSPGGATRSKGIVSDKLPQMPVLVPSIEAQKNTLEIRKEIDKRVSELDKLKELLHYTDKHDAIRAELQKMKSDQELGDVIQQDESEILEFKSSVWAQYNNKTGEIIKQQKSKSLELEDSVVKTIAAFLNTQGGKLIIGVQDRPERKVVGIEPDFQYSGNSKDIESFQNSLRDLINIATNDSVMVGTFVNIGVESIGGKSICVIDVKPKAPESWTYVDMKNWKKKGEKKECFFVRSGPSSNIIDSRRSADEWKSSRVKQATYEDEWRPN